MPSTVSWVYFFFPEETTTSREAMYARELKEYKFYLAFENTFCKDYHTEKLYSALRTQDVIPIVMGGQHPDEFAQFAPPRSYLNIDDFSSVDELARKLEYLARDESAYKEYFWWTEHYRVASLLEGYESAQCELCEVLNRVHSGEVKLPPIDLRDYWSSKKLCRNPESGKFPWYKS